MSDLSDCNKRILEDLEFRGLTLGGVIGADNASGTLQVIMYDGNGTVTTVSKKVEHIQLFGKVDPEYRAMYEMFTVSGVKFPKEDD